MTQGVDGTLMRVTPVRNPKWRLVWTGAGPFGTYADWHNRCLPRWMTREHPSGEYMLAGRCVLE